MEVQWSTNGEMRKREPGLVTDFLFLRWWSQLVESGELLDVFSEYGSTPSGFLQLFTDARTTFYYLADDDGIALAVWYEPFMGNVAIGLWARPDWRKRRWWGHVKATLAEQLTQWPLIVYMTKNANVITASREIGFVVMGAMPYLYRGETGTIAYLTRDTFEAAQHGISNRDRQ